MRRACAGGCMRSARLGRSPPHKSTTSPPTNGCFGTTVRSGCRFEDGVGFDLDEHLGGDQAADLHHAGGGADGGEEFAVGASDFLPIGDVDDEDACADYVFQRGTGFAKGGFDVSDGLHGLGVNVADAHDFAIGTGGGGAGYAYEVADAHGA